MVGKGGAQPQRMDGYVRVSRRMGREGEGYISPKVQRERIEDWAKLAGVGIERWHEDEDESGGTQNRPGLREALRRVESGEVDGIACWRLNRFARNVSEALDDVQRIQNAGGVLAFVEERIDPTGPFGEFTLTVLLAVAALELNNIKAGWKTAKERAVNRGAVIGPTPWGYTRGNDGRLTPDPVNGPKVTEAFERAARTGLQAALAHLTEVAAERTWTTTTVRRLLTMRVYLGESNYGEDLSNANAHEALVSRATWEAAQPPEVPPRKRSADYPLSGLATCATCGTHMVGHHGGPGVRMYRCAASVTTYRGPRCSGPVTVTAERLEEYVIGAVRDALAGARVEVTGDDTADLDALEAEMIGLEQELRDFAADPYARKMLGDRYHEAMQARVTAAETASAAYREAAAAQAAASITYPAAEAWDTMEPHELAEALRRALLAVEVTKGSGRGRHASPIAERVRFIGHDDADVSARVLSADGTDDDG